MTLRILDQQVVGDVLAVGAHAEGLRLHVVPGVVAAHLPGIADEQGRPLKPSDEAASLQQRGADLVRELRTITERLERLSQPPLAAVNGGRSAVG